MTLNLPRNKIGSQGMIHLANALKQNQVRTLITLYFSINQSFTIFTDVNYT